MTQGSEALELKLKGQLLVLKGFVPKYLQCLELQPPAGLQSRGVRGPAPPGSLRTWGWGAGAAAAVLLLALKISSDNQLASAAAPLGRTRTGKEVERERRGREGGRR